MKSSTLIKVANGLEIIAVALREEAKSANPNISAETVEEVVDAVQEVATSAKGDAKPKRQPKTQKPVEPEVVEDDEDEEEEEGYTLEELKGMTIKDLKALAKELEIHIPKDTKKDAIIDLIMEEAGDDEEDEEDYEEDVEDVEDVEEDDSEEEEDDEDSEDEEEELTAEDVEAMNLKQLKELADEYEIDYAKGVKKDALAELIIETLFDDEEEEEEEEADEEEAELTEDDLEEMSLSELKELADEYGVKYPKAVKAVKLREILAEELFADEDEEEDEEEADELDEADLAEEYGLNDMSVEELADLLTEHGIKAKGKKQALISKVLEAIEEGIIEVDEEGE